MEEGVDAGEEVFWAVGFFEIAAAERQPGKIHLLGYVVDEFGSEVGLLAYIEWKEGFAAAVVAADDAIQGEAVGDPEEGAGLGGELLAAGDEALAVPRFRFQVTSCRLVLQRETCNLELGTFDYVPRHFRPGPVDHGGVPEDEAPVEGAIEAADDVLSPVVGGGEDTPRFAQLPAASVAGLVA